MKGGGAENLCAFYLDSHFSFFTSRLSGKGFLQEKSKLFILNRMLYLFIALVSARRIHSLTFIVLGIRAGMEAIKFCT